MRLWFILHSGAWLLLSSQSNLAEENGRPTPTAFKRWAFESASGHRGASAGGVILNIGLRTLLGKMRLLKFCPSLFAEFTFWPLGKLCTGCHAMTI